MGPIFSSKYEEPNLEANDFEGLDFDNDFVDLLAGKRKKTALVGAKVMEKLVKVNSNRWKKNLISLENTSWSGQQRCHGVRMC